MDHNTTIMMLTEISKNTQEGLENNRKHYKDDDVRFNKIDELMKINGEHMSFIRRDLTEVKSILLEQNKVQEYTTAKIDSHIKEVKPILDDYHDMQATKLTIAKYGKPIVRGIVGSGVLIGSWLVIKEFFKNLIR